ncbi:MAG: metallophosphoesterase [Deinococcus sp.]|nr:metallophosphoesterase [Deinococcus sp.]
MRRALLTRLLFFFGVPVLLGGVAQAASPQVTQPQATADADLLRLAVLSDINGAYGATSYPAELQPALRGILAWQPDAVLSAGDLIAAQKASLTDAQVQAMWAAFGHQVGQPLQRAGLPFGFALGNHDAAQERDRREAARYWKANRPALNWAEAGQWPFNSAFTLRSASGRTLFVAALDAPQADLSDATLAWVQRQLASAPAQAAGARLVLGHLPLAGVSASKNKPGEVLQLADAQALARIMRQTGTLAYISGHHAAAYPARWNGVNVLASGGIGGRDYIGQPGSARSTWLRLTVDLRRGTAGVEVMDAASGQPIPLNTLPARIEGRNGVLERVTQLN